MNTKTMEGLVGARMNMEMANTPLRAFKEARRKGDTAAMERAMGYVNDFSDQAQEYKAEADKGMSEDAEDSREKAKLEREEAVRKRREERERSEEKIKEDREKRKDGPVDQVEISGDGRALQKETSADEMPDGKAPDADAAAREPVIYTRSGTADTAAAPVQGTKGVSVDCSV